MHALPPTPPSIVLASLVLDATPRTTAQPPSRAMPPAPGDIYPRDDRERELCAKADHPDWLYLGGLAVLDVGAVYASSFALKFSYNEYARQAGPALIGLTWGATLGGGFLALPKCDPHWVTFAPREGSVREHWPTAIAIALVAGVSAPVITSIATGPQQTNEHYLWTTEEREARLFISGGFAVVGALLPYVISPRTWSAAKELEHLRVGLDARGGYASYGFSF